MHYFSVFIITVVVATTLTWMVERIATRKGLGMAAPCARHVHKVPISRLGGVAVFITSLSVFGIYWLIIQRGWVAGTNSIQVATIFLLGIGFFVTGLIDDFRTLGPRIKLLVEVGGGAALFLSGIHADFCSGPGTSLVTKLLCLAATVAWVVVICNAINLIDGIDGLAAGAALFSMVTIFTLAVGSRPGIAGATAILAGSLTGFLIFNFNPASIFLGDAGSLFLGFVLSGLVLAESHLQTRVESVVLPLLSFALPLTEVAISLLRRFLSGHALFGADREHIHHKLLDLGLTQRQAVAILYGVSAMCTLLGIMVQKSGGLLIVPVASVLLLIVFFGLRKLGYGEFSELGRIGARIVQQKKTFSANVAIRKATVQLIKCHDTEEFVRMMEECLRHDFDGFEIILEDPVATGLHLPAPWHQGAMEECWISSEEEISMKMGLYRATGERMGSITLLQSAKRASGIDAGLISGAFRNAIAQAVENVLLQVTPEVRRIEYLSDQTQWVPLQSASEEPAYFENARRQKTF